ncbi:TonB-dependent receptor plug domain-containing protein [Flavobacteriaceae bacterium 3-367]
MNKRLFGLCTAVMACTGVAAQQQNDSTRLQKLDEVVVSDSRFPLKRENSGKTVIKIGADELAKNQGKTLAEIINNKSGLEITGSRGRDGTVLGVFARGGRGRQVLILLDGVRISDPSSFSQEYDMRLLSPANIESIEIIKGAASTLYGTNAATAVINIVTKKASGEPVSGTFRSSLGTQQTAADQNYNISEFSNSVLVNGTLSRFTYVAGFSHRFSDGLSALVTPGDEKDDFSNYSTDVKLGYRVSDAFTIGLYGNQTKLNSQFDESFGFVDAPYSFTSEQERLGVSSVFSYEGGSVNLNGAYTDYTSESVSAFPSSFEGDNYVVDVYNKYNFNERFYTILGVNYLKDRATFGADAEFTLVDPYANVVYVSPFGLNINTGLRVNNHSEYGTHLVYHINPSYRFKTNKGYFKLLGSYATSYITPSLIQLFGDFGANPNLEPEENRTIEGGLEYACTNGFRVSALYFDRKEENFITFDQNFMSINAEGTIDAQGVEVEVDWSPVEELQLNANYTFTERKGDAAIRIPKHKINASLAYAITEGTNASISYALTGQRTDTDFNTFTTVELDAFSLVDVYLSHELLDKKLKLFVNASNLLNETYTEVIGFTTRGRNLRIGMQLRL